MPSAKRSVRLIVSLIALGSVAGCSNDHRATEPTARPSESAVVNRLDTWCQARGREVRCHRLSTGRAVVVIPAAGRSRGVVLWDGGGPGQRLPPNSVPVHSIVPRAIRSFDVSFVVEPWNEAPPASSCLRAARTSEPPSSCAVSSLAIRNEDIRAAVRELPSVTGRELVGLFAQSFGATRTVVPALSLPSTINWVVLESPGPVPGSDVASLVAARVRAVRSLLVAGCSTASCATSTWQNVTELVRNGLGGVSGRQSALGLLSVATMPRENEELIRSLAHEFRHGQLDEENLAVVRDLSLRYELVQGDRVKPELVALWADSCPRLRGWKKLRSRGPWASAVAWLYRACREPQSKAARAKVFKVPMLLMTGSRDAIVPPTVQAEWLRQFDVPDQHWGDDHFWTSTADFTTEERWISRKTR